METNTPTLSGLEPLLSIEELSEYLNVPIRTLYDCSPLCGPPYLVKRAQLVACTTAGKRGATEILPEHLLYGVLRVARDPLGTGLGRRGRREAARLRLHVGEPHPLQLLFAEWAIDSDQLGEDLLANPTASLGEGRARP
jgi:hypothetical protein